VTRAENSTEALATVRRRLVEQRLAGPPFDRPEQAVRWLTAVQAQEYAEAKWSLGQRTRDCTDAIVEDACDRGEILRTHVLRPTWHFVARADIRWLLRLTGPRVHALNRYMYARLGLDGPVLAHSQSVLAGALQDGEPRTRVELADRLRAAGIDAAGARLAYLLMDAELAALVSSGPRRGTQGTYALLDDRAPAAAADDRPRPELLAELVLRYFHSHGPATIRDFTAWSSLPVTETQAALEEVRAQLEVGEFADGQTWYAAADRAAPAWPPSPSAILIGMYDETVVAYRSLRVALVDPPPRPGLLERPVVVDGTTVGSWKRTWVKRAVQVEVTLFRPLAGVEAAALAAATARFGRFLGVPATVRSRVEF
jgi:Winged helix DNA-binding domain